MKRNIIIILVLALLVGGGIYALTNQNENPPIEDNELGKKIDEEDKVRDDVEEDTKDDIEDTGDDEEADELGHELEVGKRLPDLALENLQGDNISLREYEGKIVWINFWATWCDFCDAEMPDLQKISEENDDLLVVGINVEEDISIVEKYIEAGGYDFEILLDEKGNLAREFLVGGLPTSYFVDADGIFLGGIPGMLTYEQMNEILDDIRENQ